MLRVLTLALALLPLVASAASAQSFKVGYTDPDVLINAMPEAATVQQQLQAEVREGQVAVQAMMEDFQERVERYQRQQPLLSAERAAERERELAELQQEIQQAAAQKEQELAQREAQLLQPLFERIEAAIAEVAAEQSIDLVLRAPALIHVNEDKVVDITRAVAVKLGIQVTEADTE
jgi:outer membrane protein